MLRLRIAGTLSLMFLFFFQRRLVGVLSTLSSCHLQRSRLSSAKFPHKPHADPGPACPFPFPILVQEHIIWYFKYCIAKFAWRSGLGRAVRGRENLFLSSEHIRPLSFVVFAGQSANKGTERPLFATGLFMNLVFMSESVWIVFLFEKLVIFHYVAQVDSDKQCQDLSAQQPFIPPFCGHRFELR